MLFEMVIMFLFVQTNLQNGDFRASGPFLQLTLIAQLPGQSRVLQIIVESEPRDVISVGFDDRFGNFVVYSCYTFL